MAEQIVAYLETREKKRVYGPVHGDPRDQHLLWLLLTGFALAAHAAGAALNDSWYIMLDEYVRTQELLDARRDENQFLFHAEAQDVASD